MRKLLRTAIAAFFVASLGWPLAAAIAEPLQTVAPPRTVRCTVAQTVTASSAYATGNVVGGLITCPAVTRGDSFGGFIQSVMVRDKAGQNVAYDVFVFDSAPSAQTNKTAVALTASDLAKVATPVIGLSGASLGAASTMGVIGAYGLALPFKLSSGTALYFYLVTRGAPTYASTSDITFDVVILPD
jgi:hypothetical protein